jgi:hypothetical protein
MTGKPEGTELLLPDNPGTGTVEGTELMVNGLRWR